MGTESLAQQEPNLPPLIRRMLDPEFYPHPTTARIRLIQTHISYLLLTGSFVYKVKKPVNPGFLDFTTLAKRRHFCHEELRLNQRGAPGMYLGVEAIRRLGEEFHLGSDGQVVEHAVKMRQFPQESLFDQMLAAGKLEAPHVIDLGKKVAAYHASAPTDERLSQFGMPHHIREVIDGNYARTARFIGGPQTHEQFEQTKDFTDRFFLTFDRAIRDRVPDGFIRECHGDLHLGNICLWEERLLLFDCIEFSEPLRCIDVIQDAAFAAMDLQARGRSDLAWLYLNTYLEQTGDWEAAQLLPLYLLRHAYVRAMVNSMVLHEPHAPDPLKERARRDATLYYRLAWDYSRPRQGRIILVCGLSGSGKSTVATNLAQYMGAVHIRSDAVRKHLAGIALDRIGDESIYWASMNQRTYERLLDLGALLAGSGAVVILDATWAKRTWRKEMAQRAQAAGLSLQIVQCTAPDVVLRARLAARRGDVSDAGPALLEKQRREFENFDELEQGRVLVLDTTRTVAAAELARLLR